MSRSVSGRDGDVRLVARPDEEAVSRDDGELVLPLDGGLNAEKVLRHRSRIPVGHRVHDDCQAVLDAPVGSVIELGVVFARNFLIGSIRFVFKELLVPVLDPFDPPRQLLPSQHRPQGIVIEGATESDVGGDRMKYSFARHLLPLPHAVLQQLATGLSSEPEEAEDDLLVALLAEVHVLEEVVCFFVNFFEFLL